MAGPRKTLAFGVVLAALATTPLVASAQSKADRTAAAADTKKAGAALAQKRFRDASDLYLSAYAKSKDAKLLLSAGGAMQKAGDNASAANLYARYLRDAQAQAPEKAKERAKAQKELDALAAGLVAITIKAPGAKSVTLDKVPLEMPLPPVVYATTDGHVLEGTFEKNNGSLSVRGAAGSPIEVTLEPMAPPSPPPPAEPVANVVPPPPPAKAASRKPLPPAVVFVGAGLTVVAGGLAIASAVDTNRQKSTFDESRTQENLDAGRDKQTRTNILLAATGGLAVLTGVTALLLVDWKGKPKNVEVGLGPSAFMLRAAF